MNVDKQAVARVLAGMATHEDFAALGRENVLAIKGDESALHRTRIRKASPPSADVDKRTVRYEASNDLQDRAGDVIEVSGWDLKSYQANPVVLWAHNDQELPLGVVERATKRAIEERKALLTDVRFHGADKTPKAELVWRLVSDGDLPAVSVGFRPLPGGITRPQSEKERKELGLGEYGVHFSKVELLELSVVTVPANQAALAKKLDTYAEQGVCSWAVISELADSLKQAKGRGFVAFEAKEKSVEVIDELEQPKPETKAAPVEETKSAPPGFDESTLRKIIREEVSEALGAVRAKATDTPVASKPTRADDAVGFMRSVLEQIKQPNG